MSSDEEMAIIGRLVMEQKDLARRNAVLHSEVHRIASGLEQLGKNLTSGHSMFAVYHLSSEEIALLDEKKLGELLSEKNAITKRYAEVCDLLKQAGVSN